MNAQLAVDDTILSSVADPRCPSGMKDATTIAHRSYYSIFRTHIKISNMSNPAMAPALSCVLCYFQERFDIQIANMPVDARQRQTKWITLGLREADSVALIRLLLCRQMELERRPRRRIEPLLNGPPPDGSGKPRRVGENEADV